MNIIVSFSKCWVIQTICYVVCCWLVKVEPQKWFEFIYVTLQWKTTSNSLCWTFFWYSEIWITGIISYTVQLSNVTWTWIILAFITQSTFNPAGTYRVRSIYILCPHPIYSSLHADNMSLRLSAIQLYLLLIAVLCKLCPGQTKSIALCCISISPICPNVSRG
jgi:hypothetical protein